MAKFTPKLRLKKKIDFKGRDTYDIILVKDVGVEELVKSDIKNHQNALDKFDIEFAKLTVPTEEIIKESELK